MRRLIYLAPILWITTRQRALAALIAGVLVFAPVVAIESWGPWKLLGEASLEAAAPQKTAMVASLAWAAKRDVDVVLLTGGSTSREFTASDPHVSRALTQRCGRPIRFINAGTSAQNLLESWQIAAAIPEARRRLVVVGLNYLRLEESREQVARSAQRRALPFEIPPPLRQSLAGFGAPPIAEALRPRGITWLLRQQKHIDSRKPPASLQQLIATDEVDPFKGPRNMYGGPALPRGHKQQFVSHMIMERWPMYRRNHAEAVGLWKEFTRDFSSATSRVMFLAMPETSVLAPLNALAGAMLERDMGELRGAGALVVDWRTSHGLAEEDFYDQQHLLSSGRAKLTDRFVDLLATSIPDCDR